MSDPYRDMDAVEKRHLAIIDVGRVIVEVETLPTTMTSAGSAYGERSYKFEIEGNGPPDDTWSPSDSWERQFADNTQPIKDYIKRTGCSDASWRFTEWLSSIRGLGFAKILGTGTIVPEHRIKLINHTRVQNLKTYRVPAGYEVDESKEKKP